MWSCGPYHLITTAHGPKYSGTADPMFSEIRQAILPLALRKLKRRGDLERSGLLIESLAKHWRDSRPFQLLIVAPRTDVSLLRSSLPRFANVEVSVRPESDFFAPFSRFYILPG